MTTAEEVPFTEKYRPDSLDGVVGNQESVDRMKKYAEGGSMSNLLLYGPAGTGKTTSAIALAKEIYGDDWKANFIEKNASDDRGIDVVRGEIKSFAQQAVAGDYSFKIIFLDESDNLTNDAQSALRRTMERYSDQTVFILNANYHNKLIDPIQSRCTPLPFKRLEDGEIREILINIASQEGIDWDEEAFDEIIDYVQGDARRAVHTLQSSVQDGSVEKGTLDFVNLQADEDQISEMIELAVSGELQKAVDINVKEVQPEVTDHSRFCKNVMNVLQYNDDIHRDVRFFAMSKVGEMERNILEGANPEVQTNSFLAKLPVIQHSNIPNYDD